LRFAGSVTLMTIIVGHRPVQLYYVRFVSFACVSRNPNPDTSQVPPPRRSSEHFVSDQLSRTSGMHEFYCCVLRTTVVASYGAEGVDSEQHNLLSKRRYSAKFLARPKTGSSGVSKGSK
jgi:hypothetical protein